MLTISSSVNSMLLFMNTDDFKAIFEQRFVNHLVIPPNILLNFSLYIYNIMCSTSYWGFW